MLEEKLWQKTLQKERAEDEGKGAAGVEDREVDGVCFGSNSLNTINRDQIDLETAMKELQEKFMQISRDWEREIERDRNRIFKQTLKDQFVIEQQ